MNILKNRINLVLTAEQVAGLETAILAVEDASTFLVGITIDDRVELAKLGPKSEAFVALALETGRLNEGLLPRDLDLADLERDRAAREALRPLYERMRQLSRKLDDTMLLLGSDCYSGALAVYRALKTNGQLEGLQPVLADLGRRFARSRSAAAREPQPPVNE